jgi:serine/threonine-protein kinase
MARVFAEHYEIEAPIGRGGMGSVFRVIDRRDGKTYALKVLHASASDTSTLKRFEREAAVLRRIAHDAVPKIRGYGVAGGSMYLVTEFVDGSNLRDAIAAGGAFSLAEIVRIGASIADCLNAAHTHGVIHRDIKPHNVMLTRERHVRLIDFGIARDAAVNATAITATDVMLGTPHYMSPEQFDGRRTDARSDIYSLGVVLFQLATGRLPFHAETPTALAIKHVSETPPHPRAIRPDIPMLLDRVILKCLEKSPADRYPTAGDLATDLRRTLDARRNVQRTRIGDFVVHEETGDDWALVLASPRERAWTSGMTLFYNGAYFKLERVDYDEEYPAPYVYRFKFFPETEAIRRFVDYETETPAPQKSAISRLFKKD